MSITRQQKVAVSVHFDADEYERLNNAANEQKTTVPRFIRYQMVQAALPTDPQLRLYSALMQTNGSIKRLTQSIDQALAKGLTGVPDPAPLEPMLELVQSLQKAVLDAATQTYHPPIDASDDPDFRVEDLEFTEADYR